MPKTNEDYYFSLQKVIFLIGASIYQGAIFNSDVKNTYSDLVIRYINPIFQKKF